VIHHDVVVVGAGAAGMMCAIEAGRRGRSVMVVEHGRAPGEKIRISGGGRCNFTNAHAGPAQFLSTNPSFCIGPLRRFGATDFIALVEKHGIAYHEKTKGQLFCDGSARQIVAMLATEMQAAGAELSLATSVTAIDRADRGFTLALSSGPSGITCQSLVIATGGKSIPKMGATDFAYKVATRFGLAVTETRPALVPLTMDERFLAHHAPLSGVSVMARVTCGRAVFDDFLLFTHRGLSGPAILQISSYWCEGRDIVIDLMPQIDVFEHLRGIRHTRDGRVSIASWLADHLPKRLAHLIADELSVTGTLADLSDVTLRTVHTRIKAWALRPAGSEGYRTAEVTLGGVDTRALESRTMAAKSVPGLYFIGEAADVTGWLGGYNFQWAWSSGWCAGQVA